MKYLFLTAALSAGLIGCSSGSGDKHDDVPTSLKQDLKATSVPTDAMSESDMKAFGQMMKDNEGNVPDGKLFFKRSSMAMI
jgi:hypothetical protein